MNPFWGPFNTLAFTLDPTMANADEANMGAEDFAQLMMANQNPMPIDPLNRNQFVDSNEYGLQTNDQTFQPESGATLQEMLADRELQEAAVPGLKQSDPNSLSFKYQPEFLRNYLGANPAIRDYEFDTNFYDDSAFGQMATEMGGSTSYPEKGDFYKEQEFDIFEEIPSLQRRLGNPRFSLGQPQTLGFKEESETISAPMYQDRIMNRNLPGFAYEPQGLENIIGSQLQNVKTKAGEGFDFVQNIPNMVLSAASGIPFAGQIAQGIGGVLGSLFKESPEQAAMMDLYNSPEYQDVLNQIPGMADYNPVYGMGAGYGLDRAIGKRLATINKTLGRMTPEQLAKTSLKKRKQKLEELAALEAAKDFARVSASGRRPGSGSGPTVGDSQSRGQASAGNTGGYSYDRGGRKGYGYGLKDGGLASLFTRRG
tara:strand:+ start:87 stop:1364 length:1278 start_codon:yes stop_codon:yes gene_type:complete